MKYIIPQEEFTDLKCRIKSFMEKFYYRKYYSKIKKQINNYLNLCMHYYVDETITLKKLVNKYFNDSKRTFYIWSKKIIAGYKNDGNWYNLVYKSTRPNNIAYKFPLELRQEICEIYFGYKNLKIGGVLSLYHNLHQGDIHEISNKVIPKSVNTFYRWIRQDKRFKLLRQQIKATKRQFKRYEVSELGLLQMDAKVFTQEAHPILSKSKRLYVYDFIDEKTRIALGYVYEELGAENAITAVQRAIYDFKKFGIKIKRIRTDNGAEFTKNFRPFTKYKSEIQTSGFTKFLISQKIIHETTPVRSPQSNGKIERFHRNYNNLFWLKYNKRFNFEELQDYLNEWYLFYNFKRRHKSLNFKTPFQILQNLNK